jgi:hypothetical protein
MKYIIDAKNQEKNIHPIELPIIKQESAISFTNYYMEKDGKPFIGISGEFHFSRYDWQKWEDEIIKMKLGGINIVATYLMWNHHEEIRGEFDWTENRNLKLFIELCRKHEMLVVLRVGPFDHGEVRNGGIPDWLFGLPFEVRSNDPMYLELVKRLYQEISYQVKGQFLEENGPIIAIQLENEFCHSAAPWEFTAGTTDEWVPGGSGGDKHIENLQNIAMEVGLCSPFYTATAWGGAICPTDYVLPLWGGYAFWPWIFYDKSVTEHPATPEYIFHDYHNNDKPKFYNFEPRYKPEDVPFACCEMQGGMTVFYDYRFELPYESTSAMATVKLAGGCNFVGYYMYHGGTNPKSKLGVYLNENSTPKKSYDYQAPIGEFGQLRQSYHDLKKIHYFLASESEKFSKMKTILPEGAEEIEPTDLDSLRYAIRVAEDSGYVFINNYQDHLEMPTKNGLQIKLKLKNEELSIPSEPNMSIGSGVSGILPFNYQMKNAVLKYATAQLVSSFEDDGVTHYIFSEIPGMKPEFFFDRVIGAYNERLIKVDPSDITEVELGGGEDKFVLHYLPISAVNKLWNVEDQWFLSNGVPISKDGHFYFELYDDKFDFTPLTKKIAEQIDKNDVKIASSSTRIKPQVEFSIRQINDRKIAVTIPQQVFKDAKEVMVKVKYTGDVGYAFINGEMIHDNFNNGSEWEFGIKKYQETLKYQPIILSTVPPKDSRKVKTDSPMAAKIELSQEVSNLFESIDFDIIQEVLI